MKHEDDPLRPDPSLDQITGAWFLVVVAVVFVGLAVYAAWSNHP